MEIKFPKTQNIATKINTTIKLSSSKLHLKYTKCLKRILQMMQETKCF